MKTKPQEMAAAEEPGLPGGGFRDVHDACHRWLMEHSPSYARDYAANQARSMRWRTPREHQEQEP